MAVLEILQFHDAFLSALPEKYIGTIPGKMTPAMAAINPKGTDIARFGDPGVDIKDKLKPKDGCDTQP